MNLLQRFIVLTLVLSAAVVAQVAIPWNKVTPPTGGSYNLGGLDSLALPSVTTGGYRTDSGGIYVASFWTTNFEKLWIGSSTDGKRWTVTGENLFSGINNTVRDPSIIYHKGAWYVAYTNNGFNDSTTFSVARSYDLYNWTNIATPSCASVSGLDKTWAPELFIGPDGSVRAYVSLTTDNATTFHIYSLLASDDLTSWGAPVQVISSNAYDASMLYEGGTYYLFHANTSTHYIQIATSSSPDGPFTVTNSGDWASWGAGLEGPNIVRVPGGYRLYMDKYTVDTGTPFYGIQYAESASLLSGWSALTAVTSETQMRHGTVLAVQDPQASIRVLGSIVSQLSRRANTSEITMAATNTTAAVNNASASRLVSPGPFAMRTLEDPTGGGTYNSLYEIINGDAYSLGRGASPSASHDIIVGNLTTRNLWFPGALRIGNASGDSGLITETGTTEVRVGNYNSTFSVAALGVAGQNTAYLWANSTHIGLSIASVGDYFIYPRANRTVDRGGPGSPEGVVTAPIGSTYRRTDGGAGTTWYVKESNTSGNTGWVAK